MQTINHIVSIKPSQSIRAQQVSSIFDSPIVDKLSKKWNMKCDIDAKEWNIGLIIGPSGAGKTIIGDKLFGKYFLKQKWDGESVIDCIDNKYSVSDISNAFSSVGFNTIPSWLKPYFVLSNGEKFRVEMARGILENDFCVVDEFTSVVDRHVAQICSYAISKYIRKMKKRFVGISCHYDIVDWLQPDWIIEPHKQQFRWRRLRQRPKIKITITQISKDAWELFAPYHYMSANLHRAANCYGLYMNDNIASFVGLLHRPISSGKNKGKTIIGISRAVTLPDYQGIGLIHILRNTIASAYKTIGKRVRDYPAHPIYVRQINKDKNWRLIKKPGNYATTSKKSKSGISIKKGQHGFGGRPNATFEYCGDEMDFKIAKDILNISGDF